MRLKNLITLLLGVCSFLSAPIGVNTTYAQNFYGSTDLSNKSLDDVSVNGSATMENSSCKNLLVKGAFAYKKAVINEKLMIRGSADGEDLQADHISVKGSLKGSKINAVIADIDGSAIIMEANVSKIIRVTGYLRAQSSQFNDMILESTYSVLESSEANNILVKSDDKRLKKLVLRHNSTVSGDIKFESANGEIHLYDQSKILGKVIGAEVVKK